MVEVLSVDADDERWEEEDRGDCRQPLRHLVLIVRNLVLLVVADGGEEVARELERLTRPKQLVEHSAEATLYLVGEDLALQLSFADVDASVHDAPDGVAGRQEGPPDVQEVMAEVRQVHPHLARRPVVDVLLELVDLVVDVVEEVEIALGDLVDEMQGDHPRI